MAFLDDYEPVEDRLRKFWERYPKGQVVTELLEPRSDGTYVVQAFLYRGDELRDGRPAATGLAREVETDRGVNATSALENCETSAIGRALANMGFAPKDKRPSREEMVKVAAHGSGERRAAQSAAPGATQADSDPLTSVLGSDETDAPGTIPGPPELASDTPSGGPGAADPKMALYRELCRRAPDGRVMPVLAVSLGRALAAKDVPGILSEDDLRKALESLDA